MFSGMIKEFKRESDSVIALLRFNAVMIERLDAYNTQMQTAEPAKALQHAEPPDGNDRHEVELLRTVAQIAPDRSTWRVNDHCAAHTRLYALFERTVTDLVSNYIRVLPELYPHYSDLPEKVLKSYRKGFGKILLEIDQKRYHRKLDERQIVGDLAQGLLGNSSYKLLPNAFFVLKQALRFSVISQLLSSIGIADPIASIKATEWLSRYADDSETIESRLENFINDRNDSAHGEEVDRIVGADELERVCELLLNICYAINEVITSSYIKRRHELGKYTCIGEVSEIFHKGFVVVVKSEPAFIKVGERILIQHTTNDPHPRGNRLKTTIIESIRLDNISANEANAILGQEVGLKLLEKSQVGDRLFLLQDVPHAVVEASSAVVDPGLVTETRDFPIEGDQVEPMESEQQVVGEQSSDEKESGTEEEQSN